MSDEFDIRLTPETVHSMRRLRATLGPEKFATSMDNFFEGMAQKAAGHISTTMLSGQRLNRRTGNLARSIVGRAARLGKAPGMRVGVFRGAAASDYARIQEEGGTVKAKPGKALAIPMDAAKTPAGVPRWESPRDAPVDLKLVPFTKGGAGKAGLFDEKTIGEDGDLSKAKMYYLIVKKVRIRGKHYLRDGFRNFMPTTVEELGLFVANRFRSAFWKGGMFK